MTRNPLTDGLFRPDPDGPSHFSVLDWVNRHADQHPVLTICGDVLVCGGTGFVIGTLGSGGGSELEGVVFGGVLGFVGLLLGLGMVSGTRKKRDRSVDV